MERAFYVVLGQIVPIFIDRDTPKFLGIPEICQGCPVQDWSASDPATAQRRMRRRKFDLVAIGDGSLTDQVTCLGRRRARIYRLISSRAAAILNEPEARPFPERPPSAHAAQLAEWLGTLPEAA
jgi:hypothetical protein